MKCLKRTLIDSGSVQVLFRLHALLVWMTWPEEQTITIVGPSFSYSINMSNYNSLIVARAVLLKDSIESKLFWSEMNKGEDDDDDGITCYIHWVFSGIMIIIIIIIIIVVIVNQVIFGIDACMLLWKQRLKLLKT